MRLISHFNKYQPFSLFYRLQANGFLTLCATEKRESTFLSEHLRVPGVKAFISFHGNTPACLKDKG